MRRGGSLFHLLTILVVVLAGLSTVSARPVAATQIEVSGPITSNTTWSGTQNVTGDVMIRSGAVLTITVGTTVVCSAHSDDQSYGMDTSRVEIVVENGELRILGTAAQQATVTSSGSSPGDWYGVRLEPGTTGTIEYAIVEYGIRGIPALFYIDREGKICHSEVSFAPGREQEMEQKVKELLAAVNEAAEESEESSHQVSGSKQHGKKNVLVIYVDKTASIWPLILSRTAKTCGQANRHDG